MKNIIQVLQAQGLAEAMALFPEDKEHDNSYRAFAVWNFEKVKHLLDDPRSLVVVETANAFIKGEISEQQLKKVWLDAIEAAKTIQWSILNKDPAWDIRHSYWTSTAFKDPKLNAAWAAVRCVQSSNVGEASWAAARASNRALNGGDDFIKLQEAELYKICSEELL